MPKAKPFLIVGHRGDGAGPDENTLASCRRALRHGADAIELDVQLIGGELMLAHPPRRPKESLQAVLNGIDRPVVLHLKRRHLNRYHDRKVLGLLQGVTHRPGITVSSFWPGTLTYAKRHYPNLRTAFITYGAWWDLHFAKRLGVDEFHAWHGSITPHAIRAARRQRIGLIGLNAPWERRTVIERRGIRGVITDYVSSYVNRRS